MTHALHPRHRFAHNPRQARLKKGISQAELATRCDLHRTEISLIERGGREPRLGTLVKPFAIPPISSFRCALSRSFQAPGRVLLAARSVCAI